MPIPPEVSATTVTSADARRQIAGTIIEVMIEKGMFSASATRARTRPSPEEVNERVATAFKIIWKAIDKPED